MTRLYPCMLVPVGGPVHLQTECLYNSNWQVVAVRLQCDISSGTFPSFSWLLNNSLLQQRECSKISTDQCHVLFLTDVTPANMGYYQCLARDSFDHNASWVQSNTVLLEPIGENEFTSNVLKLCGEIGYKCINVLSPRFPYDYN